MRKVTLTSPSIYFTGLVWMAFPLGVGFLKTGLQIRINRFIQSARKAHLAAFESSTILRIAYVSHTTICILSHSPELPRFIRVWYYSDVVDRLDDLIFGTMSYLVKGKIPGDTTRRVEESKLHRTKIAEVQASNDLAKPLTTYLHALLAAAC